jgi:hypothetical protein
VGLKYDWPDCRGIFPFDELSSIYSHCRNDQLLFGANHSIEIRLLWKIGGIWLKWCRERIELDWTSMIFPWCFPSEEILKFHFRILTFSSVCYAINRSNYMKEGYFQKIWSYLVISLWNDGLGARLAWLQRYVWVIQLHSIIHIVEMIRYYLVPTAVLKYDCFEKLEAFGWSDVENEAKYSGQVWFSLDVFLQKKFWIFIFAFSHFLACAMLSTNRIIYKVVVFRRFGAF